jgi:chromosome segregation ATPase
MDRLSQLQRNVAVAVEGLEKAEKGYTEFLKQLRERNADYEFINEVRENMDMITLDWRKTIHYAQMELNKYEETQKTTRQTVEEGVGASG